MRELHEQEPNSSGNMQPTYFDHPAVDVLERFVLHRCSEDELEIVETHMLACESCVCTLENLEVEIAATKLALEHVAAQQQEKVVSAEPRKQFWRSWFSVPTLSWAGAGLAACAFCLFAFVPAGVQLQSERGTATVTVPEWRNARLSLVDAGLPAGSLQAEVVSETGSLVWSGTATSTQGEAKLDLPRMTHPGTYFARLYTAGAEHELLAEFRFEVKFKL
ncbi:MAG TPA: hypothetical protein VFA65_03020 [Bryobacteraceae bacterium]|nr:hypothetical protein [Bryobacteraceae bacterium]